MAAIAFLEWLESDRNYQKGLELYLLHGTNSFLKKIFSEGEDSFNRERLEAEIMKLAAAPNPGQERLGARNNPDFPPVFQKTAQKESYPPEAVAIIEERNQIFKESSHLHSKLKTITDQEERRVAAFAILSNFDRSDTLWEKIKYFDAHGSLPPEHVAPGQVKYETDPVRMANRLRTVRTYVSRDQNNPKKAEKVEAWKLEVAYYERELGI